MPFGACSTLKEHDWPGEGHSRATGATAREEAGTFGRKIRESRSDSSAQREISFSFFHETHISYARGFSVHFVFFYITGYPRDLDSIRLPLALRLDRVLGPSTSTLPPPSVSSGSLDCCFDPLRFHFPSPDTVVSDLIGYLMVTFQWTLRKRIGAAQKCMAQFHPATRRAPKQLHAS